MSSISEEDRAALRNSLTVYLGKKPLEDDLKERSKAVHDERIAAQKQVLNIMSEKNIPQCKSVEFPYQVSLINKKRKTAPKTSDYLDTVEQRWGSSARSEVEQETKRRCTEVKEAPTLKLVKVDQPEVLEQSTSSAPLLPPAAAVAAVPVAPRYDEDDPEDESE
jgi:hypothetical protein